MGSRVVEEKRKLEEKKEKLRIQERILKERESRARNKKSAEIGVIAIKAEIDHVEKEILMGAFLEIRENLNPENREKWKKRYIVFQDKKVNTDNTPLSISFKEEPTNEIKIMLKKNGFKWNTFRKEFYGYGEKSKLEIILNGHKYKIEVID